MNGIVEDIGIFMNMEPYIQLAIPIGYISYQLAYLGIKRGENVIHVAFMTLAFALISVLGWSFCQNIFIRAFCAAILPLISAILWRVWLHSLIMNLLHKGNVANSTQFPDVWAELTDNTKVGAAQITVYLKNGEALSCDYLYDYKDAPINLLRRDTEGNIALYVTHIKQKDADQFTAVAEPTYEKKDDISLYRLTYVPKASIDRVETVINKAIS